MLKNILKISALTLFLFPFGASAATDIINDSGLSTDLLSCWELDEESSTRVDAVTGTGNDLTDNNTVLFGTGKQSNAADFESTASEYLSRTDATDVGLDLRAAGGFTVAFWAKPETLALGYSAGILSKDVTSTSGWAVQQLTSGVVRWVRHNATADTTTATTSLSVGTWSHVAFTFDGTNMRAYFNGYQVDGPTAYTVQSASTAAFNMGRHVAVPSRYYDGLLDVVAIWDRDLSASEILELYGSGSGIPCDAGGGGGGGDATPQDILIFSYYPQPYLHKMEELGIV